MNNKLYHIDDIIERIKFLENKGWVLFNKEWTVKQIMEELS